MKPSVLLSFGHFDARSVGMASRSFSGGLASPFSFLFHIGWLPVCSPFSTPGTRDLGVAGYDGVRFGYRLVLHPKVIGLVLGGRSVFVWRRKSSLARFCEGLLEYLQLNCTRTLPVGFLLGISFFRLCL